MEKVNLGMEIRKEVLLTALVLEYSASAFLSGLLGIDDIKNSRILGNKSGCLSFNQKIDLLIELGALSKTVKKKFQAFMEIRNQFMHNLSATTYENCLSCIDGADKFLLKTYSQSDNLSREKALKGAIGELCDDIGKLTANIIKKVEEKFLQKAELDVSKKFKESFLSTIAVTRDEINDYIKKGIEKNQSTKVEWLNDFGTEVNNIILKLWSENFNKLFENNEHETLTRTV